LSSAFFAMAEDAKKYFAGVVPNVCLKTAVNALWLE
jgi:hypothetical protein